jgi:hypothetical protein
MHNTALRNDNTRHTTPKLSDTEKKAKHLSSRAFSQNDTEIDALLANLDFLKIYAEEKGFGYTAFFLGRAAEFMHFEFNESKKGE